MYRANDAIPNRLTISFEWTIHTVYRNCAIQVTVLFDFMWSEFEHEMRHGNPIFYFVCFSFILIPLVKQHFCHATENKFKHRKWLKPLSSEMKHILLLFFRWAVCHKSAMGVFDRQVKFTGRQINFQNFDLLRQKPVSREHRTCLNNVRSKICFTKWIKWYAHFYFFIHSFFGYLFSYAIFAFIRNRVHLHCASRPIE